MSDLTGTVHQAASRGEADALTVLGWGLRHYAWILLLSVCALGVAVPLAVDRAPESYQAQAQVGPSAALNLNNIDPLPRLGESLFRNGSVAEAVRQAFDPPLPPSENVIPRRVNLITAQDNVVLTVLGNASTPETAAGLANVAAEALSDELNKYEGAVGPFTIQRNAVPPIEPVSQMGRAPAVGVGVLAGLLVGLGIIGLLLLRRRPVLSVVSAEAATGVRVLGQVWLGQTSGEARGLPQFCHTILSSDCNELLLVGTPKTASYRHELTRLLIEVLAGQRRVIPIDEPCPNQPLARSKERQSGGAPRLMVTQDALQSQLVGRSAQSVVVLVVPYGVSRAAVVRQVEQYLDGGAAGTLLVRDARHRWRRMRKATRKTSKANDASASKPGIPGTPVNGPSARNGSSPSTTSTQGSRRGSGHKPRQ